MADRPTIVVAYKKKHGSKVWIKTFTDELCPDRIIAARSKKYLPEGSEIIEIGVGKSFIEAYEKKFSK